MLQVLTKENNKKLFLVGILLVSFLSTNAQRWEIGGLLGGTNYLGDIAKEPNIRSTNLGINLWGRYNISRHFSYRFGLGYGTIDAHDSLYPSNENRGLGFRSRIWEFSNIFEFHYNPFGLIHPKNKNSTFYVLTGVNLFYFNPQTQYNGEWVDLQPLATEGQNLEGGSGKYSRVSVSIPIGMGYKHKLDRHWIVGFEIGYRYTYTDFLDDISGNYPNLEELRDKNGIAAVNLSDPSSSVSIDQSRSAKNDMRGDPHLNDWYAFAGVTLSYRFVTIRCWGTSKKKRFNLVD